MNKSASVLGLMIVLLVFAFDCPNRATATATDGGPFPNAKLQSELLHQKVRLLRPLELREGINDGRTIVRDGTGRPLLTSPTMKFPSNLPARIPAGTIVSFERLDESRYYDHVFLFFYLPFLPQRRVYEVWLEVPAYQTNDNGKKEPLRVEYTWGANGTLDLAPWEPATTRPRRSLREFVKNLEKNKAVYGLGKKGSPVIAK